MYVCPLSKRAAMLTIHAGDFRDVPLSVAKTTDGGNVPLDEARPTLVPDQGVDLISVPFLPKSTCIFHQGGLTAGHWGTQQSDKGISRGFSQRIWREDLCIFGCIFLFYVELIFVYLCPFCRWKWGGSCKVHHSTGRPRAISSQHSPRQWWRSCRAGWASSSHIAETRFKNMMYVCSILPFWKIQILFLTIFFSCMLVVLEGVHVFHVCSVCLIKCMKSGWKRFHVTTCAVSSAFGLPESWSQYHTTT